jgi:hypothetical protein
MNRAGREVALPIVVAPRRVKQVFRNTSDHLRVVRVRSESGDEQELRTTDEHPFFVPGRGWVTARSLEVGQTLLQADGRVATVAWTAREAHPEGVPVYNFEVEGFHTYYVAQRVEDTPVLVHNDCGRNGAFREAKRDAGLRIEQQPTSVRRVPMLDKFHQTIKDGKGRPIQTREYDFIRDDGQGIIIQDHGAGHKFSDGQGGDVGPHFNVRPSDDPRHGVIPGTRPHYGWGG